jgi:hypothetical protein
MQGGGALASRTIFLPGWAQSDDRPAASHVITVAERLSAHLQAVFIRPDRNDAFVYTGQWPSDIDIGRQELREQVAANGPASTERR